MDVIRLLGLMLILCATTVSGYVMGRRETYKIRDLDELLKSLNILQSEISYNNAPMAAALRSVSSMCSDKFKDFYIFSANAADEKNDISAAWIYGCKHLLKQTYLDNDDLETLKRLATSLKGFDKSLIVAGQAVIGDYIASKKTLLFQKAEKNRRLYQSLGVLCGLLIAVIFI